MEKVFSIKELSDAELLARYKSTGDKNLVGELYCRYTHLVLGVCMKYLKDIEESRDALMQIFEKLMKDLLHYEVNEFRFWLHTVTRNHCLMILRRRQSEHLNEKELKQDAESFVETTADFHLNNGSEKENQLNHLEKAIQQLNSEQKLCIELFYLQSKSYQEVAETTGFSMNEVKSYIQNGKRNLKIIMTQSND